MASMNERNAEIIRLHTVEKLSFGQIAQRLGITRSTVAGVLNRANVKNARGSERYQSNDLAGRQFGRLHALYATKKRHAQSGWVIWQCLCDCGNYCEVASANLNAGLTRSCGCLRKEHALRILPSAHEALRRKREVAA